MRLLLLAFLAALPFLIPAQTPDQKTTATQIPLVITGGHETLGPDRGRPVILIANALNVPPEVFREAFTHVHPAGPGQQPQPDQVRQNKAALMQALGPLGVTDDRLNQVSNYYRYRRDQGQLWPVTQATAVATASNSGITKITITNPGSGYTTPPDISVPGFPDVHLVATLSFSTDFPKNGSLQKITIAAP
jgi:hypothetical protein